MSKAIFWGQPNQTNVVKAGEWIVPQYSGNILDRLPSGSLLTGLPLLTDRYAGGRMASDATLQRDSIATVPDFEGNIKTVLAHEMRFEGARRVENHVVSQDLTSGWSTSNGAVIVDASTVSLSADGSSRVEESPSGLSVLEGQSVSFSATISGTTGRGLVLAIVETGTSYQHGLDITLNGTPTRYNITALIGSGATGTFLRIRNSSAAIPHDITITDIQSELVTNQSNQAPANFITPNDSACSEGGIAVIYSNLTNGNTVDANGVVTENPGVPIPES